MTGTTLFWALGVMGIMVGYAICAVIGVMVSKNRKDG